MTKMCNSNAMRIMREVAVVAVAVLLLVSPSLAHGNNASLRLKENASGMTYGTVVESEESGQHLDLIRAEATNGRVGYVKSADLQLAEEGFGISLYGSVSRADEAEEQCNIALAKRLQELFPDDAVVTTDDASLVLDIAYRGKMPAQERAAALNLSAETRMEQAVRALALELDLEEELIEDKLPEALLQAQKDVSASIPVYEEDGATVIGEFLVGCLQ